ELSNAANGAMVGAASPQLNAPANGATYPSPNTPPPELSQAAAGSIAGAAFSCDAEFCSRQLKISEFDREGTWTPEGGGKFHAVYANGDQSDLQVVTLNAPAGPNSSRHVVIESTDSRYGRCSYTGGTRGTYQTPSEVAGSVTCAGTGVQEL